MKKNLILIFLLAFFCINFSLATDTSESLIEILKSIDPELFSEVCIAGENEYCDTDSKVQTYNNTYSGDSRFLSGDPYEILSNGLSRELNNAYTFSYINKITSKNTINEANMLGNITRIELSKIISNFTINLLKIQPSDYITCEFNDVSDSLDYEYGYGVNTACRLGLMGQDMPDNKFRPNDKLTRAEFATVLSRLLFGTEDGNPYYEPHIKKLKEEGILTNTDPNLQEQRGYVMLMLMRYIMNN